MNLTARKPFTPGEILQEEFMQPYGLTQTKLASLAGITRRRINEIIRGKRAIPKGFQVAARRARSRAAECTFRYMSSETSAQHKIDTDVTILNSERKRASPKGEQQDVASKAAA